MRLENKVIAVTGASAGMGEAIVTRFAQEGAKIVAIARRADRLEALIDGLKGETVNAVSGKGPFGCLLIGEHRSGVHGTSYAPGPSYAPGLTGNRRESIKY